MSGSTPKIIYEDNHLLVVLKPPGIPSQEDSSGDPDILTVLKGYIKEKYHKPGAVYLGLVHRLDRPAGGLMVFARTSKAAARLSEQMRDGRFHKGYLCVCQGEPAGGRLEHYLVKDSAANRVSATMEDRPGAQWAALEYKPLKSREGMTLCRVDLITGRPHQIRVQFAAIGCPLWGDQRYNPAAKPGQWLALWSTKLAFEHPTKGEPMAFEALPVAGSGTLWDRFV